jgi:phosphoribosylpyrophosphate synthetase
MPTVRIRYTASDDDVRVLVHALEAIEGIEHVEEVADLMPHMNDDDSSSAGLVSDGNEEGPDVHDIEVLAPNDEGVRRVRYVAESAAMDAGAVAEFLDEW